MGGRAAVERRGPTADMGPAVRPVRVGDAGGGGGGRGVAHRRAAVLDALCCRGHESARSGAYSGPIDCLRERKSPALEAERILPQFAVRHGVVSERCIPNTPTEYIPNKHPHKKICQILFDFRHGL